MKLPNNLLVVVVQVLRHPITFMQIEKSLHLGIVGKHTMRTRCSSLTNPVITLFLIQNPHNSIHLPLFLYAPPIFCSSATRVGSFIRGAGADFELVDLVAPWVLESEAVASSDPEEWSYSEDMASSDPDAELPFESKTTPISEHISLCSTLDWKVVTTTEITFRGFPLVNQTHVIIL